MITNEIAKGVTLNIIPDGKYKTNYINLYFAMPLTEKNAALSNLLARVIMCGSENYPDMRKLNRALEYNYNTVFQASATKIGEKQVFCLNISCLKDNFSLDNTSIFNSACELICEIIGNVLLQKDINNDISFKEDYLELERENQKKSIAAQINSKLPYARTRCIANMCKDEAFGINSSGSIEETEKITSKELYDFYVKMLTCFPADIYIVGETDINTATKAFSKLFSKFSRNVITIPKTYVKTTVEAVREIKEPLAVAQGVLMDGFRTGVTYASKNRYAFTVFNAMLGGSVTGKLFMNVREKLSLCYTCASLCDFHKGILIAYAGIDPEMKGKTQEEILRQTDILKSGDATEEEFTSAKNFCINRVKEIANNPSLIAFQNYTLKLAGHEGYSPASDIQAIEKLSCDEIIISGQSLVLDTIYFLAP